MPAIDLKHTPIPRLFFTYFIPSLFTMLALSTYSVVDGILIGRKLGSNGLAAIGITWPLFPLMIAIELLFSFGGATLSSFFLGRAKPHRARVIFSSVFYSVVILSVILSIWCYVNVKNIALWLGANAVLYDYVVDYLRIIFIGMGFILLHPLVDTFVVNDRRPVLASISMIVAAASNIILNYYFIFILDWGVKGSALATILAHMIGFAIIFWHFLQRRGDLYFVRIYSLKEVFRAMKAGIPQCSAEVSAALMMFLFNLYLMDVAGERGVAIYSIMMYSGIFVFTLLFSISQGLQPIASFSHGAGLKDRTRAIFRFTFFIALGVGVALYVLINLFAQNLIHLFLDAGDEALVLDVMRAIRIYFIGYIFLGVNMLSAIYLLSIHRTLSSFIVTLFYTIIFIVILLPLLSRLFGINGIWASYPL